MCPVTRPEPGPEAREYAQTICRVGRDTPFAWRSSWVTGHRFGKNEQNTDYFQVLCRRIIPAGHVGIVRRIEADVLMPQDTEVPWRLGPYPCWWQPYEPNPEGEWDWSWNVGETRISEFAQLALPGFLAQLPAGRGKDRLSQIFDFNFCDDWQHLGSWSETSMGNGPQRYAVEGPAMIFLLALAWWTIPGGAPLSCPFGPNVGSMEGITIPIFEYRRSEAAWLAPG